MTVVVNALLNASVGSISCSTTIQTGSYCVALGSSYLQSTMYLEDETNGSQWGAEASWVGLSAETTHLYECHPKKCKSTVTNDTNESVRSNVRWTFATGPLRPTHLYELAIELSADVQRYDATKKATMSGGSCTSMLSLAGPGLGFWLESAKVVP